MIATIAIGATLTTAGLAFLKSNPQATDAVIKQGLMSLPLVMAIIGIVSSFLGIISMRVLKAISPQAALRYSTFVAAGLFLLGARKLNSKMV